MHVEIHSAGVQDRPSHRLPSTRLPGNGWRSPPVRITARFPFVERTFAWITINRCLAKDFERFAETVQTLIQASIIKLMIRRVARYRTF